MIAANQRNLLWPLLVIGLGLAMLLLALNVLPASINDLLERAWPLLLVIAGLNMLLADRVRWGNWLALALSLPLMLGIIYFAYDVQRDTIRTENVVPIPPEPIILGENLQGVTVNLSLLDSTAYVRPIEVSGRAITATFTGSRESQMHYSALQNEQNVVDFVVTERRQEGLPNLAEMGRGHLDMRLPVGIPIQDLRLQNQSGGLRVDLRTLQVPRFTIQSNFGDVDLFLPTLTSPDQGAIFGNLTLLDGNLRIIVEREVALRVTGATTRATLDSNIYLRDSENGLVETRNVSNFVVQIRLDRLTGSLTILTPQEAEAQAPQESP
jgi:hypothetical protein